MDLCNQHNICAQVSRRVCGVSPRLQEYSRSLPSGLKVIRSLAVIETIVNLRCDNDNYIKYYKPLNFTSSTASSKVEQEAAKYRAIIITATPLPRSTWYLNERQQWISDPTPFTQIQSSLTCGALRPPAAAASLAAAAAAVARRKAEAAAHPQQRLLRAAGATALLWLWRVGALRRQVLPPSEPP